MKLLANNVEIPILKYVATQNIFNYYSYVEVEVMGYLPQKVQIVDKVKLNYYVISSRMTNNSYVYTLVTEAVYQVLNTRSSEFTGDASARTLISNKLGFKCAFSEDTSISHWSIPQSKLIPLIKILNFQTKTQNGGGIHFFLDIDGMFDYLDLKKQFEHGKVQELRGQIVGDSMDLSWIPFTPGQVNIVYNTVKGPATKTLNLLKDYGVATMYESFSTEYGLEQAELFASNAFYTNYYTARTINLINPDVGNLKIGNVYKIMGTEVKAILTGISIECSVDKSSVAKITLTLSSHV